MIYHDYNVNDFRKWDLESLKLTKDNFRPLNYVKCNAGKVENLVALEFDVTHEIAQFAFNLAYWKLPFVYDKPWLPKRSNEEKIYHIFLGSISECLMYLYLKFLGIEEINYYDVERNSPIYNPYEEYDLKIKDYSMSLKVIPSYYETTQNTFSPSDLIIKATSGSHDKFYTQFLIAKDNTLLSNESGDVYLNWNDFKTFYSCLVNGLDLPIKAYLIGGIINYNAYTWEGILDRYSEEELLNTDKIYNKYGIKINNTNSYDIYIKNLLSFFGINNTNIY